MIFVNLPKKQQEGIKQAAYDPEFLKKWKEDKVLDELEKKESTLDVVKEMLNRGTELIADYLIEKKYLDEKNRASFIFKCTEQGAEK